MKSFARVALLVPAIMVAFAASADAAFTFTLRGALGPGVQTGVGTTTVGNPGVFNVRATSDQVGGEALNAWSLNLILSDPVNFAIGGATSGNFGGMTVTTDTVIATIPFQHLGAVAQSSTLGFNGVPMANGGLANFSGLTFLNAVPEPSTFCTLGAVIGGVCLRRRRKV